MRRSDMLALALGAALLGVTALRLPASLETGNALNHVSGAWIALANDLAHGTFYRPTSGADGYGGTRFFPLAFALHAALIRAGVPALAAGHVLSAAAAAALLAAVFLVARRLGLGRAASGAAAALPLAGAAVQLGLGAIRGDLLPAALAAAGFAALLRHPQSRRALPVAAAALALAIAAKPTAGALAAAAVAWLWIRDGRAAAVRLAGMTVAGAAAAIVAAEIASGGRFLSSFGAAASGGMTAADALRAPVRLATVLVREDRGGLALLAAAALAIAVRARRAGWRAAADLPALWLAAAAGSTLVVLASPGTGLNHLVDIEAASAAVLAGAAVHGGKTARIARAASPVCAALGIAAAAVLWRADAGGAARLADAARAVAASPSGPLLSEDPLVPLTAGMRPWLLDAFSYRLAAARDPGFGRPLLDRIRARAFGAIVLLYDPDEAPEWYARVHLGPEAIAAIRSSYGIVARAGRYVVLAPRPAGRDRGATEIAAAAGPGPIPARTGVGVPRATTPLTPRVAPTKRARSRRAAIPTRPAPPPERVRSDERPARAAVAGR